MITWFRLRELSRNASISWSTLPLDTAFLPVFTQTSHIFIFTALKSEWETGQRANKWPRTVFCKNVNKRCTSIAPCLTLWTAKWLFSFMWRVIIDGTAHWWRTRALYTASWKDEKRWNDETPVTSAWPLHDKTVLHQLSAGFMWLFLCLGPFFYLLSFLFLLVKNPWNWFGFSLVEYYLPNGPHTHTCDAQTCFYMIS